MIKEGGSTQIPYIPQNKSLRGSLRGVGLRWLLVDRIPKIIHSSNFLQGGALPSLKKLQKKVHPDPVPVIDIYLSMSILLQYGWYTFFFVFCLLVSSGYICMIAASESSSARLVTVQTQTNVVVSPPNVGCLETANKKMYKI